MHQVFIRPLRTLPIKQYRLFSHINTSVVDNIQNGSNSQSWQNAKPFEEIPGPTKVEVLRMALPGGLFYKKSMVEITALSRENWGDLFIMPGLFGKHDFLMCFNPDDFPTVLRSEGSWPKRRGLETMVYHRRVHRKDDFGDVVGLLSSNDEEWTKIRTAVNPVLMQPQNARLYLNKMLEVNDEFLKRIREIRDPVSLEMPDTFEDEINRLAFESVAVVALNQQIGLIRKNRNNEQAKIIFSSIRNFFQLVAELEFSLSLWKFISTRKFKEVIKNQDIFYENIMKYINQALEKIENVKSIRKDGEEKSVLEKLLKIDKKIAIVMALDLLVAGIDTTSSTLAGILLGLAKHPEKQEILRQEMLEILPQKDSILTIDSMKNLPYLRACIKEGIRMYPIGGGTVRTNREDIVMSGYRVPKNQDIVIFHNWLLLTDEYCPRPKEFIPERWIRGSSGNFVPTSPFLNMPFGFGARSCVGKRLVEMELEITVARLVRNFYIEFNYSIENAFKNRLINVPAIPLKYKFTEVEY